MFTVIAGKHDDQEPNYKYISEEHATLDEAIKDYDRVSTYPWAYIEYRGRVLDVWGKGTHPFAERCK